MLFYLFHSYFYLLSKFFKFTVQLDAFHIIIYLLIKSLKESTYINIVLADNFGFLFLLAQGLPKYFSTFWICHLYNYWIWVRVITVFTVFRLLTDFVCLYNYEFWLSLCKIVRSSVILLLPLFMVFNATFNNIFNKIYYGG